jgi:hypothetical protein
MVLEQPSTSTMRLLVEISLKEILCSTWLEKHKIMVALTGIHLVLFLQNHFSWDRSPYLWGNDFIVQSTRKLRNNFFIMYNYLGSVGATRTIDFDDASSYYESTDNVLLYGLIKYRNGNDRIATRNVLVVSTNPAAEMQADIIRTIADNSGSIPFCR